MIPMENKHKTHQVEYLSDDPITFQPSEITKQLMLWESLWLITVKYISTNTRTGYTSLVLIYQLNEYLIELYQEFSLTKDVTILPGYQICHVRDCQNIRCNDRSIYCCDHEQCLFTQQETIVNKNIYHSYLIQSAHKHYEKYLRGDLQPIDYFIYNGQHFKSNHYVIHCWKQIGETPLDLCNRIRKEWSIPDFVKSCYTGRLDPMAQGITTILTGTQNLKLMNLYNSYDKVYYFNAILGVDTSSYDPMGNLINVTQVTDQQADDFYNALLANYGTIKQYYPAMSAHKHKGKPLWLHAQKGTLPENMPFMNRTIYNISSSKPIKLSIGSYVEACCSDMKDVIDCKDNIFNTKQFITEWETLAENKPELILYKLVVKVHVSSGTFVRSIVHDTAKKIGIPGHAFRITRTSVNLKK